MEICCSSESLAIVADNCGFDPKDRKGDRLIVHVPLYTCNKDVTAHFQTWNSGIITEYDLILSRASVFERPKDVDIWTICPLHRSRLGLRWTRGGNTKCRIPAQMSNHNAKKLPKADRGLAKVDSEFIFQTTGYLIPVGSGNLLYSGD